MNTIEFLRQFRAGPYAIFDIALSFVGVYLLAPLLVKILSKINLVTTKTTWLLLTLPLGIVIHLIFGQQTQMVKDVFSPNNHYVIKTIIITLTYLGLKNIKISRS